MDPESKPQLPEINMVSRCIPGDWVDNRMMFALKSRAGKSRIPW